jgi:hypothetical protein
MRADSVGTQSSEGPAGRAIAGKDCPTLFVAGLDFPRGAPLKKPKTASFKDLFQIRRCDLAETSRFCEKISKVAVTIHGTFFAATVQISGVYDSGRFFGGAAASRGRRRGGFLRGTRRLTAATV